MAKALGRALLWSIDGPAWALGSFIGHLWPILMTGLAVAAGVLLYRLTEDRLGQKLALVLSIIVGLYAALVGAKAADYAGVTLLHLRDSEDY
jgi:hypothetical protein